MDDTGDVRDQLPGPDGFYGPYPPDFCDGNIFCDRTLIEIIDPCENPFRVAANGGSTPPPYTYGETLTFTINPFTIEPEDRECENVEWSCSVDPVPSGGENCDICASINFEPTSLVY